MIDVCVADDHDMVRDGFVNLINQTDGMNVIFQTGSVASIMTWIKSNKTNVLVTDLSFADGDGFDVVKMAKECDFCDGIVVLSMHDTEPYIKKAFQLGAAAYLSKASKPTELLAAIRNVNKGVPYYGQSVIESLEKSKNNSSLSKYDELTQREKEVFLLLARGSEVKRVASKLDISFKTAHVHKANISEKLDVRTPFEMTQYALRNLLISAQELYEDG